MRAQYRKLRKQFQLTHSQIALWLGATRKQVHYWYIKPTSNQKITERIRTLQGLSKGMEPQHRPLLFKLAYSPIYGNPLFGEALQDGVPIKVLKTYYDELFSRFEYYRNSKIK